MKSERIVVLRAGDAAAAVAERRGQYAAWIKDGVSDAWQGEWAEHDLRADGPLPTTNAAGYIITGSSSSVTERAPWMLRAEAWLRDLAHSGVPVLGICFGHQLLAQALGGSVAKNPKGREIGTVEAELARGADEDPLFAGIGESFSVNSSHVDAVVRLPIGARVLATTGKDARAAFAIGANVRAVQFHPEFDGDVMRGYVFARAHLIEAEGLRSGQIVASASDTPDGPRILQNFVWRFVRTR